MAGRYAKLAAVLLGAYSASGCWAHHYYVHGPVPVSSGVVYVHRAPPAPHHIRVPPRPAPAAIWIGGYWRWSGADFVWVDGYWNSKPPPGRRWTPGTWVHTSHGWYWRPGRWR